MKSWCSSIFKQEISGVAIITFAFPPNYSAFASKSPIDRVTDNRPGKTRWGPKITLPFNP